MYLRRALMIVAMLFTAAAAGAGWAQQGLPYATLSPPQPTGDDGKIEVIEFFWYGCPHCYHLEPEVNAWAKALPADVVFKRIPAYPSEAWGEAARIFYTLQAMGLLDKFHEKVFEAIHKDNVNLVNKKIRDEWLTKNGIEPKKYDEVAHSFTVASEMQRDKQMTMNYKVDGVPRLVVGGKYYTSGELAGGADKIFPVVDEMIAKVRQEGQGAKPAIKTTKK
jgi:thiol:disulfide interchange protein DsbA